MGMILKGDCIEVMKAMKPNSVDAIVCDPPYGLEFMGKEWDKLWDKRMPKENKERYVSPDGCIRKTNPVTNKLNLPNYKAGMEMQLWHIQWLTEAYRVLKPGGSMLVMGGTRTSHRLACAIEDSGFILKDTLAWNYGSGFPKAQDFSKATLKKFLREWLEDVDHFLYKDGDFQFDCPYNCHLCDEVFHFFQAIDQDRENKQDDVQECSHPFGTLAETLSGILCKCKASYASLFFRPAKQDYQLHIISSDGQLSQEEFSDLCQLYSEQLKKAESVDVIPQAYRDSSNVDVLSCEFVLEKFEKFCHSYDISRLPSYKYCNRINQFIQAKLLRGHKIGGLKPAWEPILYAVKPPEGSYVDNVLKWGVGAVNVDECRVGYKDDKDRAVPFGNTKGKKVYGRTSYLESITEDYGDWKTNHKGRFPANVILSHHPECVQVGMKRVKGTAPIGKPSIGKPAKLNRVGSSMNVHPNPMYYSDKDGLETVESWDCHPDCAVRLLDEQSGNLSQVGGPKKTTHDKGMFKIGQPGQVYYDGNAGASRFFYCAKASRGERNAGLEGMERKECFNLGHKDNPGRNAPKKSYPRQNNHPTVKPIKLFEYLIKLVTREGQIILDPFIGSGTTSIAAHNTGRKCIGIEKEDDYLEIAKRRITYWQNQPKQMELR